MAGEGARWRAAMTRHFQENREAYERARECKSRGTPEERVECAATIMKSIKKGRKLGFM